MTIKYDPLALEGVLKGEKGLKRLRNREGYVTFQDPSGELVVPCIDGLIPELHELALAYDLEHPRDIVTVHEYGCAAGGPPSPDVVARHVGERMG